MNNHELADPQLRGTPMNADAEKAVLSCVLQWPETCFERVASVSDSDGLFYIPANLTLWKVFNALQAKGSPLDTITVNNELSNAGDLEKVGGAGAVADLIDDIPSAKMLGDYLRILGEARRRRKIIQDGRTLIAEAYDSGSDIESASLSFSSTLNDVLEGGSNSGEKIRSIKEVTLSTITQLQDRFDNKGQLPGVSTGFTELDNSTNGFLPGKMHVVAARPGVGKTAIGFQFIQNAAKAGVNCGVFSAEMFGEELVERGISSDSGIDGLVLRRGTLKKSQMGKIMDASNRIAGLPVWIDDRPAMGLNDIIFGVRRMVREHGVKLVLVDYLQFIREPEGSRSRVDAVTKLSAELTNLAKETGVAMIVLAQLNRASEGREGGKPKLSDLRDSGTIEQDAYGVILLHEKQGGEEVSEIVDLDLIVAKWRGGRLGPVPLIFEKPTSTFTARHSDGVTQNHQTA